MTYRFEFKPGVSGTEICLVGPNGLLPVELWALEAPAELLPGVDLIGALEAGDRAIRSGEVALVENSAIAELSAGQAMRLALPPLTKAMARISSQGLITSLNFRVQLDWLTITGQPVLGAERIGAFLRVGRDFQRIPDALFSIAEGVDALNHVSPTDMAERFAAVAALKELLPAGAAKGVAEAAGLIGQMKIAVADAFSLDAQGNGDDMKLIPILHRAGSEPDASLLAPAQQQAFGEQQFNAFSDARAIYTLSDGWYVVLQPPLRRALSAVRRINSASAQAKRAFMANPRAHLREVLGEDVEEIVLESVFRETPAYADRVVGLGLWTPRVVPWIKIEATDWFGPGEGPVPTPRVRKGITVGDRPITLDCEQAEELRQKILRAIDAGQSAVEHIDGGEVISIPADDDTLRSLAELARPNLCAERSSGGEESGQSSGQSNARHVLIIKANEESLDVEDVVLPHRPAPAATPPRALQTSLLPHQGQGLAWLQEAWRTGLPGVLLADDMGLGKTLQGLAFLAWLREGMDAGVIQRAPVLVVAPTGLLQNWRAEHDRHLREPGLGVCTQAFGRGLSQLKRLSSDGQPRLAADLLANADWVLTTYETLRDYQADFGVVPFAAALFDEAQKIKTPAVRVTDAAKAVAHKAQFRIAMTGTPVENRLSDLWCITDTVQPGVLGDLKGFSARYEGDLNLEKLRRLKASLEFRIGGRPPIMLRRLKEERLPDLPKAEEKAAREEMTGEQREAYLAVIAEARQSREAGAALKALHALRAISLHPNVSASMSDAGFIAASARLRAAFAALDEIAARRERALIFLDDLELQSRLAGIVQRRHFLRDTPLIINGTVTGTRRQAYVDRFQTEADGFQVMILSPKAGGVGLTLTAANHVIHLTRWWNPAVEDQCNGRVLRIGQTRPVSIHLPMALLGGFSSFDDNLAALLARKRKLMHETLLPFEATAASDVEELFKASVEHAPVH